MAQTVRGNSDVTRFGTTVVRRIDIVWVWKEIPGFGQAKIMLPIGVC